MPRPGAQLATSSRLPGLMAIRMSVKPAAASQSSTWRVGAANVEFRLGEIEHLPIADNTADVVISNCVINLVSDKAQVYREAFRVLKPGGRIAIADVVNIAPLPPELSADATLLCTCLASAATTPQVEDWLAAAGFSDIRIAIKPGSRELEDVQKAAGHRDPGTTKLYDRRSFNPEKAASFFATY